jgi:hypothetical protein
VAEHAEQPNTQGEEDYLVGNDNDSEPVSPAEAGRIARECYELLRWGSSIGAC